MTHKPSSLQGILSSNMLFDGFDYVFDLLFDRILTHLTGYLTAVFLSTN